jgi:hypothetical protein
LYYKQENWSQVCEDIRQSRGYLHKANKKICFEQNKRYVGSYEEIKFKWGCWKLNLISGFSEG